MSTVNGIGTLHYGWEHLSDGSAHATKWFVLAFFPVVPIRREHLRVLDPPAESPPRAWLSHFEVLGFVPMTPASVLKTYFKAYVIVPLILIAPVLAVRAVKSVSPEFIQEFESKIVPLMNLSPAIIFLYWPIVISLILDRAKGRRK